MLNHLLSLMKMSKNKIMELGNQKMELQRMLYNNFFTIIYKEKSLTIDNTLNSALWFKINCDKYVQYTRVNYGIN